MAFPYPASIDTPWKKAQYIMRMKEYVRLLHNFAGYWKNNGLTQDEYDNGVDASSLSGQSGVIFKLTDQLKAKYPYMSTITKTQWSGFIGSDWEPRWAKVEEEIGTQIKGLSNVVDYDYLIDLDIL